MSGKDVRDYPPRHPKFNGVPIMIGDTIRFANHVSDEADYFGEDTGVVTTIRMVRGEPWIHVTQDGSDNERNEVIYDRTAPDQTARGVVAHWPAEEH